MGSVSSNLIAMLPLTWLDAAALVLLLAAWAVYQWYADYSATPRPRLGWEMDRFVREWLTRMAERDNRMVDVNVLRNLTRSSQFFASTTMLILGALVALMGYAEKVASVVAELPFTQQVSERAWELKIVLLLLIFVYAFFKFSWSIRQFSFSSILVQRRSRRRTPSSTRCTSSAPRLSFRSPTAISTRGCAAITSAWPRCPGSCTRR
jgi:uncharacterized membrane protein